MGRLTHGEGHKIGCCSVIGLNPNRTNPLLLSPAPTVPPPLPGFILLPLLLVSFPSPFSLFSPSFLALTTYQLVGIIS
jgi:hypothetical protein